MKTDLNSLKKEFNRLTDIDYLKKELNRVAGEVRNFDISLPLTPQAKKRLGALEKRFNQLVKSIADLQKQVDASLDRFLKAVRGQKATGKTARSKAGSQKKSKTSKKTAKKTTPKKAAKKTGSSGSKTGGSKKTSRKSA